MPWGTIHQPIEIIPVTAPGNIFFILCKSPMLLSAIYQPVGILPVIALDSV